MNHLGGFCKHGLLALTVIFSFSRCVSTPSGDGQKKSFIVVPAAQEKSMGEQAYAEILKKEKVSKDKRLNSMLQRVGKRIAAQSPVEMEWQFTLIESKEMNAFCLPGGKVAFYTGILPVVQNEAALAIVMGHEVAHAVARHGAQRMSQALGAQMGLALLDLAVLKDSKYRNIALASLGLGTQVGIMLPFSRSHETEADVMGLKYAAAAGYDPAEAPKFWERFAKATSAGGKPPQFLSTHPADTSRIKKLNSLQSEAQALYSKSPRYGLGEKI